MYRQVSEQEIKEAAQFIVNDVRTAGLVVKLEAAEITIRRVAGFRSVEDACQALEASSVPGQFGLATGMQALAHARGLPRSGYDGSLAGAILDQQARKIKQFKASAYKLSEKQCEVVVREYWHYYHEF